MAIETDRLIAPEPASVLASKLDIASTPAVVVVDDVDVEL